MTLRDCEAFSLNSGSDLISRKSEVTHSTRLRADKMDTVLLLVIAGLCVVSSHAGRTFHFVHVERNWTEAQRYCREKYTDLATISSMKDMNTLTNSFNLSEHQQLAWIGLYDDVDSWRWSLSDTSFYGHGETEFRLWRNRQPDNEYSGEYCTEMYFDGDWNDAPCDFRRKAVCCDVTGSNVTFVLSDTFMNWTEAQSYCRQHHTDLASVRNLTENLQVHQLRTAAGETHVWIGLFRDPWKWSDGGNSSFRYWSQSQPNNRESKEACVAANFKQSGNWEDWNCDYKRAFICYSKPEPKPTTTKQVFRLRLSKEDSSLDLNDPAVAESLLKQIKQKLKDQGLSDDVKLSWRKQPGGKIFHKEEKKKKKKKKTTKDEL